MLKTFGNVRDGLAPARAFGRRYIPRAKLKKIHSDKRARLNQKIFGPVIDIGTDENGPGKSWKRVCASAEAVSLSIWVTRPIPPVARRLVVRTG
jgi:hypothetical protein